MADVTEVVLSREEIRDRLEEAREAKEEAISLEQRAEEFGREKVWGKLLKQSLEQEEAERDRLRQMRRTTRERAMELVGRLGGPPHSGADTSRAAAERIEELADNREELILTLLLMRPGGMTDQQMQETLGMRPDTQRPGRWLLSDKLGLVFDSGKRRETEAGNDAIVWVAWRHLEEQASLQLATG